MKLIELQEAFELEIGVLDNQELKPSTSDIEYWLNAAVDKFVKTRYSGLNFKREGFEQSQKRIDDLRTLVTIKQYAFNIHNGEYTVDLPNDYAITVGETAIMASNDVCWPKVNGIPRTKHVDVLEATIENFDAQMNNSLSMHRFRNNSARPLRLYIGNQVKLYTDEHYYLPGYSLTYLRIPAKIDLSKDVFEEYSELPATTHIEIVKLAASLYLENQGNPRYESYYNEINSME